MCTFYFQQLSKWFVSLEDHERQRSVVTLLLVEEFVLENIEPSSNVSKAMQN